jgi:hypothetical protein
MNRELTSFERMVLNFMDRAGRHYRNRMIAAADAGNFVEAEEILQDACERYEDWATD